MLLKEIFNTPQKIKWTKDKKGVFYIDGIKYCIKFYTFHDFYNSFEIIWFVDLEDEKNKKEMIKRGGAENISFGLTNIGKPFILYSVVIEAIKYFVTKNKPDLIWFSAAVKEQKNVYIKLLRYIIRKISATYEGYYLVKNKEPIYFFIVNKSKINAFNLYIKKYTKIDNVELIK